MSTGPRPLDARTRLLVLTGAGVSAESGLATFRGAGGLWEGHPVEAVASPDGFRRDPALVWRFYSMRRAAAAGAEPNAGHRALATLEARLGERFLLVTQNVDGLHARAGSRRLEELHGSLWRTRCSRCELAPFADDRHPVQPPLPECPRCGGLLRPDIVWFGEALDDAVLARVGGFLRTAARAGDRFVFLAVGTSGVVWPAAGYVHAAREVGAETWLANLEAPENDEAFDHRFIGPATRVLPELLEAMRD